ncbi:MAG: phospholipase D-like domain-containing protein [Elusimicrobiota bacterium]|nr:phospholipase D-like domain-containing protein [Elusimicrobiota bacterium]
MNPGRRLVSALLVLLALAPAPGRARQLDFDGRAPSAAAALPLPLPFVPAPAPPRPPAAFAPAVPVVSFKGLSFKAVQFSRAERIPETLVAVLDRTQRSALLALYELKLPAVADAIIRAKRRGVSVLLVFDEGHSRPSEPDAAGRSAELQRVFDAGVPVRTLRGGGSYGIMHHKTAVLDGELVVTGSFNWTQAADERNYENLILRDDPAVVASFDAVWRWMWEAGRPLSASASEADDDSEAAAAGMGSPPSDGSRPVSFNGGSYPAVAFSPQGGTEAFLLDAITRARRRVDIAMFSFYSQPLAQALLDAKARGVRVRVVADTGQARRSEAIRLLQAGGVELRLTGGRTGGYSVMHHKYMVLDGRLAVGGSYNFSNNAEQNNHENTLFSTEPGEVAALLAEQEFVFGVATAASAADLPPLQ